MEWMQPDLSVQRKRTPERKSKTSEDTKRRRGKIIGEVEVYVQEVEGRITRCHHSGPEGDWAAVESGRMGSGRAEYGVEQREGGVLGRENHWGRQGPGRWLRTEKGWKLDEGQHSQDCARDSLGRINHGSKAQMSGRSRQVGQGARISCNHQWQCLILQQSLTEFGTPPPHNSVILHSPDTSEHIHTHTINCGTYFRILEYCIQSL